MRHKVHSPAYASFDGIAGGMVLDLTEILDISESGISIHTASPLTPNRSLNLVLDLSETKAYINTTGYVAWADQSGRAGVRFSKLPDSSQRRLKEWLLLNALVALAKHGANKNVESEVLGLSAVEERGEGKPKLTASTVTPVMAEQGQLVADAPTLNLIQEQVEALGSNLDTALQLLAEHAQAMTRASGAAIALGDGAVMVCRASSGEAPGLGAHFQIGSGFSGLCVHTGRLQRCDDAEVDSRVDSESCRRLSVRSIIAEPVLSSGKVIGLIEVFSPHPFAFEESDAVALHRLGQMIVQALNSLAGSELNWRPALAQGAAAAVAVEETSLEKQETQSWPNRRILLITVAATLAIVLAVVLGTWLLRMHGAETATGSQSQPATTQSAAPSNTPAEPSSLNDLRRLAAQGDPVAQFALGARYATGDEVKRDYSEAVRWFSKAADQGHVVAQATLGAYYWAGRGVPQDLSKAYFWSVLAWAGGDEASKYRVAALSSRMTHSQVQEGQQRANNWIRQHQVAANSGH